MLLFSKEAQAFYFVSSLKKLLSLVKKKKILRKEHNEIMTYYM